jgi:hypothetical protein
MDHNEAAQDERNNSSRGDYQPFSSDMFGKIVIAIVEPAVTVLPNKRHSFKGLRVIDLSEPKPVAHHKGTTGQIANLYANLIDLTEPLELTASPNKVTPVLGRLGRRSLATRMLVVSSSPKYSSACTIGACTAASRVPS